MNRDTYKIYFNNGLKEYEIVRAFSISEAHILAQAIRIQAGLSYDVYSTEEIIV